MTRSAGVPVTLQGRVKLHLLWSQRLEVDRLQIASDERFKVPHLLDAQGVTLAEELIRRHLQDHGDYPRGLVVDLWGSATMRTAGEEFAMALHLLGAKPLWDMNF